ncbi:TonB-dependent receptor [Lysobacter enzymogenes]|uniref:TonB-dependent receptor n=1 Tax=Lysobacter enzymogenes TaxID=69 RepID=A0A0S2DD33_LYSEN|nr:TonB-dependent receptor [Lysobacter enzymogenes]ALN56410.1 TonB-dependent receptor [Lysobacter enzymogenes]QCW25251.1 TonB-dependent receptor [Lysobacter enzymogenes]
MLRPQLLASAVLAVLIAPIAQAEEAKDLDRVTVSASTSRTPNSEAALANTITVIDAEQLKQQLAVTQDVSQILANLIPSFSPSRQKLTNGGETLRGRKPLYLVDGVPQSTPLREGGRDGHTIDPAMIERIEVIHGANALQGLGASGGIINIITKRAPRQDGQTFQDVNIGVSSALPNQSDSVGYRASYLFGTRSGDVDFVGGASYASEGLFYDGNGDAIAVNDIQGDLMDARSYNLFAKAGWDIDDDKRLQLTANRYQLRGNNDYITVNGDIRTGKLATSARGSREGRGAQNRSTSVVLDYTDKSLAGGYFNAQLFWVDFNGLYGATDWEDFWRDGRDPHWWDQSQNVSEKIGGKFGWSRDNLFGQRLRATIGLDWNRDKTYQELVVAKLKWVPQTTYESWSPFAQAEWWVTDKVMLTAGVRHERGKLEVGDFTTIPSNAGGSRFVRGGSPKTRETLPNYGVVFEATDALKFYASYSEGYTVADIGRVLRGITTPNQSVDKLVDLSPVVSDNREIGVDFDNGRWLAHLAAYWSDSDLGSRLQFDRNTQSYFVVRERTEIRGIEGNVAFQFSDNGRAGVGYARGKGRYDSDGDDRVDSDLPGINISPDRITAFWDQTWNDWFSTRLQGSRALDRDFDSKGVQVASTDGYTTVDLQGRFKLPLGQLNVGIENLFDEQYITYYSQSTPRNDTYVAGRGRVLNLSWSHRF